MSARCMLFLEPKGTILEVIREAKARGYHVAAIVSDPSLLEALPVPYNSALSCIDQIERISGWDSAAEVNRVVDAIDQKTPIAGIYFGVDACAIAGAQLRVRFGLPTPSSLTMKVVLDKHLLRQTLREEGLSQLQTFHSNEVEKWRKWEPIGAAYFKPIQGSFSIHVKRCENLEDLKNAQDAWLSQRDNMPSFLQRFVYSRPEYHLEEAIDGELLSVEGLSSSGQFQCIGLTSRILYSKDQTVEMGSVFPYPHPMATQIIEKVRRAHEVLKFTDGPTHVEVIVSPSGQIEIIDFNPRFIGADVLQSINHAYGIQIEKALCDWALGITPEISPISRNFSCIQYILPHGTFTFESIDYPSTPEVKFQTAFLLPGSKIVSADRQIDYVGCYLTVMPTFEEASARSKELRDQVRINKTLRGAF